MEKQCKVCGASSPLISSFLGVCLKCIRQKPDETYPHILEAHSRCRSPYGLPSSLPRSPGGVECGICSNECRIGEGEKGFCGLRENVGGRLHSKVSHDRGVLYSYLDPHVTNCCAAWFCPAGTGSGYPKYSYRSGPETGY
ncbi:MAG: radical SAM protein, partial [Candidatus Bathyarchaeia archaeon]